VVARYILPLGMGQYWDMFAPDPMRDSIALEADVVDSRGLRYGFAFPRAADYPIWSAVPKFRHPKFAANLADPECQANREVTAHYVVRQLGLPARAFPVDVALIYQVRTPSPPGGPPADPMTPTYPRVLATLHFARPEEVRP
jgi:hypothetical protein